MKQKILVFLRDQYQENIGLGINMVSSRAYILGAYTYALFPLVYTRLFPAEIRRRTKNMKPSKTENLFHRQSKEGWVIKDSCASVIFTRSCLMQVMLHEDQKFRCFLSFLYLVSYHMTYVRPGF